MWHPSGAEAQKGGPVWDRSDDHKEGWLIGVESVFLGSGRK